MDFTSLMYSVRKDRGLPLPLKDTGTGTLYKLLAIDPGHTTGIARFTIDSGVKLIDTDQRDTSDPNIPDNKLLEYIAWANAIVMEEYRVYSWRAKHHAGSDLLTARVIGGIETFNAIQNQGHVSIIKQPAHVAKGFCKDKKLKEWGFYQRARRHANDAVRHGCYYMLFNKGWQNHRQDQDQIRKPQVG